MQDSPRDPPLNGTLTIAEMAETHPGVPLVALGKQTIKDAGKRLAQIRGLKPGSSSIRTPEMIEELLERLMDGEALTSILCDEHMPANRTLENWRERDAALEDAITSAQAKGQRVLADLRLDIAAGGVFSTGEVRRDELLIKTINANLAQRNRREFGERIQIDRSRVVVNLPDWAGSVSSKAIEHEGEADDPA